MGPREGAEDIGLTHYCKGGVPGKYPTFDAAPHPVLFNSLYDPLGASANMPAEKKERRLRAEINNGRLAMLGIFGFLCAQTIPGSVPALAGVVSPYAGQVMSPFSMADFGGADVDVAAVAPVVAAVVEKVAAVVPAV